MHADYTVQVRTAKAKDTLGDNEFDDVIANGGRVVQVNVWLTYYRTVESSPLALANVSIPEDDLIATDQRFPDRVGEIYQLAFGKRSI